MTKILVADDSLTIQKVIGITLASSGHELVECLNEVDLFRLVQAQAFDLVLLDFNLSEKLSGYELAKQIKGFRPDVPIMIMLGFISILSLVLFKAPMRLLKAEILFGVIDNGVLAIFALSGAELFGILGAIVGSLIGNAITDGFAGIFEGYEWQKIKKLKMTDKRTALTVAVGKFSGCLFGGGIVLTIAWSILNLV